MKFGIGLKVPERLDWLSQEVMDIESFLSSRFELESYGLGVAEVILGLDFIEEGDSSSGENKLPKYHAGKQLIETDGFVFEISDLLELNLAIVSPASGLDSSRVDIIDEIVEELSTQASLVNALDIDEFDAAQFFNDLEEMIRGQGWRQPR